MKQVDKKCMDSGETGVLEDKSFAQRTLMRRNRGQRFLGSASWLVVPLGVFTACGPIGGDGFADSPDGIGAAPSTGGVLAAGGGWTIGTGGLSSGGWTGGSCDTPAPQRTYVCAGYAYEGEAQSAAYLSLYSEYCASGYPGTGGWAAVGGSSQGGYAGEAVGGGYWEDAPFEDDLPNGGFGGEPEGIGGSYYPAGGAAAGGAPVTGGGPNGGGGNSLVDRWCDSDPEGTVVGGISFAVGSCQDVDVALPLLFQEPSYGEYEVVIYGSYAACDRAYPITTAAGLGTGQVLEIPFSSEGYAFISVEVRTTEYSDFGVRLRDRPHVVPTPSGE